MNTNETIVNEEVIEMTEDIIDNSGKGLKMAGGIGLAVLGGVITYRCIVRPIVNKIKSTKELKKMAEEFDENDVVIAEEYAED